jgi:hypothetical protein
MLNHVCTLPFLLAATVWRFCEGGVVCANATNITYYGLTVANAGAAEADEMLVVIVGLFMYRWIIWSWVLLPIACCMGAFCSHKHMKDNNMYDGGMQGGNFNGTQGGVIVVN